MPSTHDPDPLPPPTRQVQTRVGERKTCKQDCKTIQKLLVMETNKQERLDVYSKILLVTGAINYNALQVNNNLQCSRIIQAVHKDADTIAVVEQMENNDNKQLNETLKKLSVALEELGDYMNNCDMTQPIDIRITTPVFEIIHGKDLIED